MICEYVFVISDYVINVKQMSHTCFVCAEWGGNN